MTICFAAVLYPKGQLSDATLSRGFALTLAGWDLANPHLLLADLPENAPWSACFYQSGLQDPDEAFDQAVELFEEELPPGLCVRAMAGQPDLVVYAVVFTDDFVHDDVVRFSEGGVSRRFVRDGEDGVEAGQEDDGDGQIRVLEGSSQREIREHRGTTWLQQQLGIAPLPALAQALYAAERKLALRLVDPDADSIAEQVRQLNRSLGRQDGRGSAGLPEVVAGVALPDVIRRFASIYDWADPADPDDRYRDIAIGDIEGTLRFIRGEQCRSLQNDAEWKTSGARGNFPVALMIDPDGGGRSKGVIALGADGEGLRIVGSFGIEREAGPTFGELILYLALGWRKRSALEEELIQALMLRARVRAGS
jgi:hypothetical protein